QVRGWFDGLFPRTNPRDMRFAINYFTSIGLGGLTEELREHLRNAPKLIMQQQRVDSDVESDSDSDSDDSDSDSDLDSDSDDSESDSSDSSDDDRRRSDKRKTSSQAQSKSASKPRNDRDRIGPRGNDGGRRTSRERDDRNPRSSDRYADRNRNGGRKDAERDDHRRPDRNLSPPRRDRGDATWRSDDRSGRDVGRSREAVDRRDRAERDVEARNDRDARADRDRDRREDKENRHSGVKKAERDPSPPFVHPSRRQAVEEAERAAKGDLRRKERDDRNDSVERERKRSRRDQ
ncbi:pre-mRNA-splicing factor cwc22, partial [Gonapodya sp. JEL0774]